MLNGALRLGPDARRYLLAGAGEPVARPFHLRVLLPWLCRDNVRRWWLVWFTSWPLAATGATWWAVGMGASWTQAAFVAVLLLALPGVLGPPVARPVGVDLPCLAVSLWAAGCFAHDLPVVGVAVAVVAVLIREQAPIWIALWAWNPWALLALIPSVIVALVRSSDIDPITALPALKRVHDHPVATAFEHRAGRWRDAWLLVMPWGATLAALIAPTPQVVATLAIAHGQLLVATDTVRLLANAAGPVMALAATNVIPSAWWPVAAVLSIFWWRKPELV